MTAEEAIRGMQNRLASEMTKRRAAEERLRFWQSKGAKQKGEIARLSAQVHRLQEDKAKLLADVRWMRGEPVE